MASVSVNLSEELRQFVTSQVEAGQFDSPSGYIEALITRAKRDKEKLEPFLVEGLDSGDPMPLDADEWKQIRRDVKQRLASGQ